MSGFDFSGKVMLVTFAANVSVPEIALSYVPLVAVPVSASM